MDKFDCLKVFTRVASLGSFTGAANELNTTQSAVSKKIAWLEKEVGVTLFHRHARAITLTASGTRYRILALKLLDEIEEVELQLRQEQASVSGTLKLSVPSAFSVQLLSSPLNDFMALHPDLCVDVSVSDKFVDLVEGDIDIAFRAAYLKDSGLKAKWIMDNELVYFATPDYLDNHPLIQTAYDLSQHHCLTYSLSTPSNLWRFNDDGNLFKVKVSEQFRSNSPEMILQMTKLGRGVAAAPRWMIKKELETGMLQQVLQHYQTMSLPMYLVYKDSEHHPQRIRSFIDFMSSYFTNEINV